MEHVTTLIDAGGKLHLHEPDHQDGTGCRSRLLSSALGFSRNFGRGESGNLSIFSVFTMVTVMLLGGIGVDFMHSELKRTKLQATLDRAVLAAADLDQSLSPAAVVNDYFTKSGNAQYLTSTTVDEGINHRTVSAEADMTFNTFFLRLAGVDTLPVHTQGSAKEEVTNVEISLVLDISGSMDWDQKINHMRNAAKEFVDTVLNDKSEDRISISLIPYSEHVNAGPEIFSQLNMNQRHNYSYCVEFPDSEYDNTDINTVSLFTQAQHFQFNSASYGNVRNPVCPKRSYEQITAFSGDAAALKSQINKLKPRAGTAIYMGMKWATAMLDPSFQGINQHLISQGKAPAVFSGRPVSYNDPETLKTVVLMTDGINSYSNRLSNWAYNSKSEYKHWAKYNMWYYLNNYVHYSQRSSYYYKSITPSHGDSLLDDICDAAKAAGIVVWSVGFEVTDHGADVMKQCASSPSHFFRVEGVEISDAFTAIAQQINQLRLIQ